ncbi:PD-(D/E)XK nuclease family protein, partial [Saccharomonospora saliphila]|uniref:PD-(D/E)XK nuclease family protein n=1 Tax=Saccharomonospora saliphila TaxID=369829 RepID=UPI001E2E85A0
MAERAEQAGLVDAVDDPGDPARYSREGYARIRALSRELGALRRRLDQPLPELVADVERTMRLDVEALARPGGVGRAHLDAFADVVGEYAETVPTATLLSLLDYLATADHAEDGLAPGEVEVAADRVQVLTAHSAKGLEWRVVAVPHLVTDTFPGKRRSSSWLKTVAELPAALRGDAADLPELALRGDEDRKLVTEVLADHERHFAERHAEEERRLCYVALTRSEHCLLVSGHWWNSTSAKPKGPSEFLTELADVLAETDGLGTLEHWAPAPGPEESNPLVGRSRSAVWPVDPLGDRRKAVDEGARLVLDALATRAETRRAQTRQAETRQAETGGDRPVASEAERSVSAASAVPDGAPDTAPGAEPGEDEDPDGWITDTDVLLAERARHRDGAADIDLPGTLSVSQLVELADEPEALARRLRRPLPFPPNAGMRRGTAFHGWLERRFAGDRLLDLDDLPGSADLEAHEEGDRDFEALREAFERSPWAARTPHDVEVPFSTDIDGVTVRGRMDAVFADPDGGWTVVDWKTGAVPPDERMPALSVQLAAYRLAWAGLSGAPLERVRAAFHYVRSGRTVHPVD